MAAFGDQFGEHQVGAFDQGAGGIVNLPPVYTELAFYTVGGAMRGQKDCPGGNIFEPTGPAGASRIHLGQHIGVMDQVSENGEPSLAR
jgi:hypothetical protein